MGFVISALILALAIVSVVDIIRRPDDEVRYLPKFAWVVIVLLFPTIGAALWWGLGRVYTQPLRVALPRPQSAPPARTNPTPPPAHVDTRSTEQQIADLDREIEEWRLRSELEKRNKAAENPENSPED